MDIETVVLLVGGVLLAIWLVVIIVMVWIALGSENTDDYLRKDE